MGDKSKKTELRGEGFKANAIAFLASSLMRVLTGSLRVDFRTEKELLNIDEPVIYCLWHNRIFTLPALRKKHLGYRKKVTILTSASKDGAILAKAVAAFGLGAVRGSSSRRAVAALVASRRTLKEGSDLVITPDGPRGPRYSVQAGALKLAILTGAPLVPIRVEYDNAWQLKTWDRFNIPKPFSKITITFGPHQYLTKESDEAEATKILVEAMSVEGEHE